MPRERTREVEHTVSVATLLKGSADTYMTAALVKRVANDLVRKLPYPAIGAAALIGAALGVAFTRRRAATRIPARRRLQGRLPKTAE
jgi:hypothetical protein